MIRRLQIKLIVSSMAALLIILVPLVAAVNIKNSVATAASADGVLDMLRENGGTIPSLPRGRARYQSGSQTYSAELPFEMRYFTVLLDEKSAVAAVNTERISSVDDESAGSYAERALGKRSDRGYVDNFRYLRYEDEVGVHLLFVSCARSLEANRRTLVTSSVTSLLGIVTVLALTVLLSRRAVRPVSESYEKQKRFISDAGHELRTPVTVIGADCEILESERPGSEWVQDIRRQARRLSELTDSLIYLSRMEEQQKLSRIEFPLSDLVSETASSFRAPAELKGLRFTADVQEGISFTGNSEAMQRLTSILLDNAVKYSGENGSVALRLEKQGRQIRLSCTNTADGITDDMLRSMFDRFYRSDAARGSGQGGYGLGLSIARSVAELHRGSISASSPDGKTLTVTAVFPVS